MRSGPNPSVSSASEQPTPVTGSSGVKMNGTFMAYVPPVYWYVDKEAGGAHGYNTETSPGPAIPTARKREENLFRKSICGRWTTSGTTTRAASDYERERVHGWIDAALWCAEIAGRLRTQSASDDVRRRARNVRSVRAEQYVSTGVIQWIAE